VSDDGRGLPAGLDPERAYENGRMGLAGMRERLAAVGGSVSVRSGAGGGVELTIRVPLRAQDPA
jgi:signal transduction histidine kinase